MTEPRAITRGRTLQAHANAVVKGGITPCGHTEHRPSGVWVCIRPDHEGPQPTVDQWRRTHGHSTATDRHYLVRSPAGT